MAQSAFIIENLKENKKSVSMTSVLFLFKKTKTHNLLLEMLGNQDKSRVKMSKIIHFTYTTA